MNLTPTAHNGQTAAPCDVEFTIAILRFLRSIECRQISRDVIVWQHALEDFTVEQIAQGLVWHARNIAEAATVDSLTQAIRFVRAHRSTRLTVARARHWTTTRAQRIPCPVCAAPTGGACVVRGRSATYRLAGGSHCARFLLAIHRIHPEYEPLDAEAPA